MLITITRRCAFALSALAFVTFGGACAKAAPPPKAEVEQAIKSAKQMKPVKPPADAIVVFTGKEDQMKANLVKAGTQEPAAWKIEKNALIAGGGSMATRQAFADCILHVEFRVPFMPDAQGQGRANSGIGMQERYEIQVLDSFGLAKLGSGDCGSIYSREAPLVNAAKPPTIWQSFDIIFRTPRFGADGKKVENARATVYWNGTLVQNNEEFTSPTGIGPGEETAEPKPIVFQDHGAKVEFRNIWVVPVSNVSNKSY